MRRALDNFTKYVGILLVILLILWSLSTLAWNSWVTNVYLAGQPGNTKEDVERLLGPIKLDLPLDSVAKQYPSLRRIDNAVRAISYINYRWVSRPPITWEAIIVYNKRGNVITSRIYLYESDIVRDE